MSCIHIRAWKPLCTLDPKVEDCKNNLSKHTVITSWQLLMLSEVTFNFFSLSIICVIRHFLVCLTM